MEDFLYAQARLLPHPAKRDDDYQPLCIQTLRNLPRHRCINEACTSCCSPSGWR